MKKIKDMKTIIKEFVNSNHSYKALKNLIFYKDFLKLLNLKHQQLIEKIFIKNDTLTIITYTNIGYQELNHDDNKFYIKILIKNYSQKYPNSPFTNVKNIKIFSNKFTNFNTKISKNEEKISYIELSNASFKNNITNEKLHLKFEKIRQVIKNVNR